MATNTIIKPWTWGDEWGFVPAIVSTDAKRVVHVAGQCDQSREDGHPYHPGDMAAQIAGAMDNLEAVLAAADMTLADVVRLNYYVTDVEAFNAVPHDAHIGRLAAANCHPASTLLGITALAMPGMMVEIEATRLPESERADDRRSNRPDGKGSSHTCQPRHGHRRADGAVCTDDPRPIDPSSVGRRGCDA